MKNKILAVVAAVVLVVLLVTAYILGTVHEKRIAVDFEMVEIQNEEPHKYQFLQKDVSDYICSLSEELEIDSDLVVAILMAENPEFDPEAVHRNTNGTIDCGLFQLNDKYVWTSFRESYWFHNIELNPFNWKHSSYLAMHHIAYLTKKMKVNDEVIMAYNCGIAAVMSGAVPETTKVYLKKVKTNLFLLKQGKSE